MPPILSTSHCEFNGARLCTRVHASSHKQMKKCATKMKETNKKKRYACKNVIHERKPFVMPILKTGENNLHKFWLNDSRYNEIGAKGMVFQVSEVFSNSLFVHSLVCPITHSFLDRFQPNLLQHFP